MSLSDRMLENINENIIGLLKIKKINHDIFKELYLYHSMFFYHMYICLTSNLHL